MTLFFPDSCKIKKDVIKEFGISTFVVQVTGREMGDRLKERNGVHALGSPW